MATATVPEPLPYPPVTKHLLNENEAAEYIGVKPQTLSAWRCRGSRNLKFIKVGRLVRYRRSDLDAWMERRTATSVAAAELATA